MRRRRTPRHGAGTAWLVADGRSGAYLCYWYVGTVDGHLVEHARAASASDAVTWGRLRTSRVRIRTADACTYWAGTGPPPEGFTETWTEPATPDAAHRSPHTGPPRLDRAAEPNTRRYPSPPPAVVEPIPPLEAPDEARGGLPASAKPAPSRAHQPRSATAGARPPSPLLSNDGSRP